MDLPEYDGASDCKADSLGAILAAFSDPYYVNVVEPDERKFIDKASKVVFTSIIGTSRQVIHKGMPLLDISHGMEVWRQWQEEKQSSE